MRAPELAPAQSQPTAAPREAPSRFMIAAIDVSGSTKLSNAEIERLIYPHLGPDRSNEDVIAAQKALQAAYAARGFEAVDVEIPVQPNETFAQGIVQLIVHEAPLGKVQVVDAKHHSASVSRAQVPTLVEGQPINIAALQSDIAGANRFPDRQISPRFKPGSVPGTVDVDLQVEDHSPVHASLEVNNDNSPNTRPLRLSGTARYSNVWGQGHTLSVTGALAPQAPRESNVVSASYTAPLIGTPWSFLLYGYKSNSNVAALGGTNVLGNGWQIGLRATYRLPGDTRLQQVSFGPDFKAFKEVSLTDSLRYGVQWNWLTGDSNFRITDGTAMPTGPTQAGFSYFFAGSSISAALNALEQRTNVKVVSAPKLITLNNQTAALQVGDQVPIASGSAVSVENPNAPIVNSIAYRDTGVILKVTPRVNAGGLVLLDIAQEVSDVNPNGPTGGGSATPTSPTISTRRISTSVAVQDGQVIALGGLFKDSKSLSKNGLPILSRLPIVGAMFGNHSGSQNRTELIVLLKPHVIRTPDDGRAVTEELRSKLRTLEPFRTQGTLP